MRKILVGAALAATLVACGNDNPHHLTNGTVLNKKHSGGYYDTYMSCVSYGKYGNCLLFIPQKDWVPDEWTLTIQNCDQHYADPSKHPTCDVGKVHVDQGTFNTYAVGVPFPAPR